MKIFLTGGSGFVGSRWIDLNTDRIHIVALERKHPVSNKITSVQGDLLDRNSLIQATRGCDCIVHNGGATPNRAYLEGSYDATLIGTKNLIEAGKIHGIKRFIFVSTDCVTQSEGPYALSKLKAEKDLMASGLDWTIFRPKTIVGSKAKDLGRMMKFWSSARWIPVIGDGTYLKQPVFVDDFCEAITRSIENKASFGQTITVAGADSIPFNDFVSTFANRLGNAHFRLIHFPLPLVYPAAAFAGFLNPKWGLNRERVEIITHSKMNDIAHFEKLLGFPPTGFKALVQKTTADWLKTHGIPSRNQ
ncbi:MAG: NAD-dependent epimerase/dehydratase family protein [Nitrospiria bacterium]